MQHPFFRLLIVAIFAGGLVDEAVALSGNDLHSYESEATAHALSEASSCAAAYQSATGNAHIAQVLDASLVNCPAGSVGVCKTSSAKDQVNGLDRACTSGWGDGIRFHGYQQAGEPPLPECEDPPGLQFQNWTDSVIGGSYDVPSAVCVGYCAYDRMFQSCPGAGCYFSDTNGDGQETAGEPSTCCELFENGGNTCNNGAGGNELPAGQPSSSVNDGGGLNCQNTDCGPNPGPGGGGSGEPISGGPLPGQDPSGGPRAPGGDGDPSTPTPGGGDGTGDITGPGGVPDGERDIDCNPQSNPDCGFTGSGTGSGNCDVQPSCSGDPVQCAILYQEWAGMCYDGAEITNPRDCNVPITCDGDVLFCEAIAQERRQYCDVYYGDGTVDTDVFSDSNFGDDPKQDADEVDIPDSLDSSGFAGGSACPAPVSVGTGFSNVEISIQPLCDLAGYIRPMVILSALILGAFIVVGARR